MIIWKKCYNGLEGQFGQKKPVAIMDDLDLIGIGHLWIVHLGPKPPRQLLKARVAKHPDKQRGNSDFFVKCPSIPVEEYRFLFLL